MPAGWVALGTAVVGAYSASQQSKAAKKAAQIQADAAGKANDVDLQIFNQQRQDQAPFRQAGLVGLNQYMNMLGLGTGGSGGVQAYGSNGSVMPTNWFGQGDVPTPNPDLYGSDPLYRQAWDEVHNYHLQKDGRDYSEGSSKDALQAHMASIYQRLQKQQAAPAAKAGKAKTPAQLQQDAFAMFRSQPGYQFGLDEGNKQVQASAAARGGLNSGATLKALLKFGQNYADQQGYTPYMNRLAALSGMAQTSTNQLGQAGQNYAGQVGQNLQNAGQARAQGIYDSQNAWTNYTNSMMKQAGNMYGGSGY